MPVFPSKVYFYLPVVVQTPFNFGDHPLANVNEFCGKEFPRTKASLLDFHTSENPTKQEGRYVNQITTLLTTHPVIVIRMCHECVL